MLQRIRLSYTADTGLSERAITAPINGKLVQVAYSPSGTPLDTGATIELKLDTGGVNQTLVKKHLVPAIGFIKNIGHVIYDTGGEPFLYAGGGTPVPAFFHAAGDRITGTLTTDTGDVGNGANIYLWFDKR